MFAATRSKYFSWRSFDHHKTRQDQTCALTPECTDGHPDLYQHIYSQPIKIFERQRECVISQLCTWKVTRPSMSGHEQQPPPPHCLSNTYFPLHRLIPAAYWLTEDPQSPHSLLNCALNVLLSSFKGRGGKFHSVKHNAQNTSHHSRVQLL